MTITRLFREFAKSGQSGGYVLLAVTTLSLLIANFGAGEWLNDLFHTKVGFVAGPVDLRLSVSHWVNDGLMAIFFLLVGLEIERELYIGELSTVRNASFPVFAAIGGMLFPFLIYILLNISSENLNGAGIPMATDIAFALGVLSLVKSVPYSVKVFLTAFAIIDDLGAILIIAFFYTSEVQTGYLTAALCLFGLSVVLNRLNVNSLFVYLGLGVVLWYCLLQSGVHATIAGVLVAFATPFRDGGRLSPSYKLQHALHNPVAFIILPLFAFVNTAIIIPDNWVTSLLSPNSLGIVLGLVIGKPLGVLLVSFLAVRIGWSALPANTGWSKIAGAAVFGGVGFTMSIFITLLAFESEEVITESKMAILMASSIAAIAGFVVMKRTMRSRQVKEILEQDA
jgi:Na+:H+ antiporter, NhaA family